MVKLKKQWMYRFRKEMQQMVTILIKIQIKMKEKMDKMWQYSPLWSNLAKAQLVNS